MGPSAPVHYALEGAVAVAGAAVQWLRDSLGLIKSSAEMEPLARAAASSGGVCFVPAFSGLYAPHWDPSARGCVLGLSFGQLGRWNQPRKRSRKRLLVPSSASALASWNERLWS